MQNKANFSDAQVNVTSFRGRHYDDFIGLRLLENKANSKVIAETAEWWSVIPAQAGIQSF
ncbi:MAG: hypothetical protein JSU70_20305 [Phycisphaerales bacterium]|nr:MAG: hypothetical protein JSU70_20305 [Phycisphaerales bacterium]